MVWLLAVMLFPSMNGCDLLTVIFFTHYSETETLKIYEKELISMSGKKRVVSENVEVDDVVAEATEKKGLFAQLAKGVKGAGNWCVKH